MMRGPTKLSMGRFGYVDGQRWSRTMAWISSRKRGPHVGGVDCIFPRLEIRTPPFRTDRSRCVSVMGRWAQSKWICVLQTLPTEPRGWVL